ncbi:MAG: GumC family protein [Puniceicoccaceae bacterium]
MAIAKKPNSGDEPRPSVGYSYNNDYTLAGYGGDYGGGGAGDGGGRSVADYLILLRERLWYVVIVFLVVFLGALLYTFKKVPQYTAVATIEVLRLAPKPMATSEVGADFIRSGEDLNTEINLLNSGAIIGMVNRRLRGENLNRFLRPYSNDPLSGPVNAGQILSRNRKIVPKRLSLNVEIHYTHPDPEMAAIVANLFAEEYRNYNMNLDIERTEKSVNDLTEERERQRQKVEDYEQALADFRKRYGTTSIKESENIVLSELQQAKVHVGNLINAEQQVQTQWNLIQEYEEKGLPLYQLDFIASRQRVGTLLAQRSDAMIQISTLAMRYKEKWPAMIAARETERQIESELQVAVENAKASVYGRLVEIRRNLEKGQAFMKEKNDELLELASVRVGYNSIQRDYNVAEADYQRLVANLRERESEAKWKNARSRIIDPAIAPSPDNPSSPNKKLNLAVGAVGGLGLGIGLAMTLGLLDNRVKSAYDIEQVIGLPLLGIVPRMSDRLSTAERARAVYNNIDSKVTEAFRSIHSAVNLSDQGKVAQVIMTTSTLPAEGKTFITINLALTYAGQGQKTLLVDADLRLPSVAKAFGIRPEKGLYSHFFEGDSLDDVIVRGVAPNCDLLPVDRTPENPTQVLNSVEFEEMLIELRHRYHRIIVDSPPVGAVSDPLCLLSLVDGMVYVVKFNSVRRKAARTAVRNIHESETPVFGAVLNSISAKMTSYYYSHYYDYGYRDYYVSSARQRLSEIRDTEDKRTDEALEEEPALRG